MTTQNNYKIQKRVVIKDDFKPSATPGDRNGLVKWMCWCSDCRFVCESCKAECLLI